ncbi:ribonuclease VapC [Labrys miyagiensis]|uniref:Ribonuclease VapC n=1 Tax=Labrys miyagiensis TaxID=346912 RepID=A0ABQ6CSS6_9HYPH|nr:type II toxin-antitoxin system VapC family toxin [Labrys miyagiensis]GLS22627.1 ribonuclease VapC [Labrys miyagiensis]
MRILLDTNVLTEVRRVKPDLGVLRWLDELDEDRTVISVISLAEIRRGIVLMDEGRRKADLAAWLAHDLPQRFAGRVLSVNADVVLSWGDLMGQARKKGVGLASLDAFIAATAHAHDLILATRNISDFQDLGLDLINPWD